MRTLFIWSAKGTASNLVYTGDPGYRRRGDQSGQRPEAGRPGRWLFRNEARDGLDRSSRSGGGGRMVNSDPILEVGLTRFVEGLMWSLGNGKRMTEGLAQQSAEWKRGEEAGEEESG